ncbi:MAG TPA: GGDEF domain-containing protein [Pseudolabrys sp.]|nr:GGDEF domain-containing protein [Pseudolabrys sp.]
MDTRTSVIPMTFDAAGVQPVAVTRWTALLADPQCEQDYRLHRLDEDRRRAMLLMCLVSLAGVCSFLIELYGYLGNAARFAPLVPSFVSIWLPLGILLVVRRVNVPHHLELMMVASGMIGTVTRLSLLTLHPSLTTMWTTMMVGIVLLIYLYLPLRLVVSIGLAAAFSVMAPVWWTIAQGELLTTDLFLRGLTWLALANALGFIAANSLQRSLRVQFAQGLLLQRLLSTDAMTNIANRRRFDDVFAREWRRCGRSGMPLSLLMIDVDHFKAYNDHSGHVEGDECLRQVAKFLGDATKRPGDLVARYGGEEFVCLLPEIGVAGAKAVADKLVEAVRRANIPHPCSPLGPRLTISVGSATAGGLLGDPKALVAFADKLLYAAKAAGRDQVKAGQLGAIPERAAA